MGVRGLFEPEEERLAGRDECGVRLVVVEFAYGFVVQAGSGLDERGGHGRAGERAVDEEGAGRRTALQASVFLLVVEDKLVAQLAGRGGEVGAELVCVGAVSGKQPGRQAEGNQPGEGVDGMGAGVFTGGVQDQAESELRMSADASARVRMSVRLAATSGVALWPKMPSSAPPQ